MKNTKFETTMRGLGYILTEVEKNGLKLQYKKEKSNYSDLFLVFNLDFKIICPILVPKSVILQDKDFAFLIDDFKTLKKDANLISDLSQNKFKVLNQ